jgi:hypothetical protein
VEANQAMVYCSRCTKPLMRINKTKDPGECIE